jgi:transcriptional regulator with XRE-family HTH domain
MSQRELAEAVGYATKSSMNKIEAGETSVPIPRLTEIARVLRVPLRALMDEPSDDFIENGFTDEQEALATYAYNSTSDTAKALRDHLVSAMKLLDQERGESEIEAKFNRLTPPNQKSVMDMIDFLLAQQKAPSVKGEGS